MVIRAGVDSCLTEILWAVAGARVVKPAVQVGSSASPPWCESLRPIFRPLLSDQLLGLGELGGGHLVWRKGLDIVRRPPSHSCPRTYVGTYHFQESGSKMQEVKACRHIKV